jgi:hypothetical protein
MQADVTSDVMLITDWEDWLELKRFHGDADTPDLGVTFMLQDLPVADQNTPATDAAAATADAMPADVPAAAPGQAEEDKAVAAQDEAPARSGARLAGSADAEDCALCVNITPGGAGKGAHEAAERRDASEERNSMAIDMTGGEEDSPGAATCAPSVASGASQAACHGSVCMSA